METEAIGYTLADAVREFMDRHGIAYSATFVPFSQSRNAKPNATIRDMQINWRVTFTRGGRAFTTDYSQGIGWLPDAVKRPWKGADSTLSRIVLAHEPIILAALERGVIETQSGLKRGKLEPPTARDVLESLALDAGVEDFRDYEEWASEHGYDEDSRKGERIYNECLKLARDMRYTFGPTAMRELRAIDWNV